MAAMAQGQKCNLRVCQIRDCVVRYSFAFVLLNSLATCTAFGGHPFGGGRADISCERHAACRPLVARPFREKYELPILPAVLFDPHESNPMPRIIMHSTNNIPATDFMPDADDDRKHPNEDEDETSFQPNPDSTLKSALALHAREVSPLLGTKSIGIDYGGVRTGLAAPIGYDFRPLRIVSDLNNTDLCEEVVATAKSENAERIVIGLPLHKNGTESERSNITRCFASELSASVLSNFGPDFGGVYLWDERYTSKAAKALIMSTAKGRGNVRSADDLDGTIDADAACLILEHYYQSSGVDAELVEVPEGYVRDECLERWNLEKQRQERAKEETRQKREEALNARQVMMNRVKELEAASTDGDGEIGSKTKRKKKKKKKKK